MTAKRYEGLKSEEFLSSLQVAVRVPGEKFFSEGPASDGVGLMRTEFLFLGRERLPDEEEQYRAFAALLDRFRATDDRKAGTRD